jgi:hypothetical protein
VSATLRGQVRRACTAFARRSFRGVSGSGRPKPFLPVRLACQINGMLDLSFPPFRALGKVQIDVCMVRISGQWTGADRTSHFGSVLYGNDRPTIEGSVPFSPFGSPVADRCHGFI